MSTPGYTKVLRSAADSRYPSFLQGFNRRWLAPQVEAVYLCFTAEGTAKALDDALFLRMAVESKSNAAGIATRTSSIAPRPAPFST